MNADLARPQPGALTPRAVAAVCCLRSGAKTNIQIRNCIGDQTLTSTRDLLRDLRSMGFLSQSPGDERWYLTHDGVGWLETNGLRVNDAARLPYVHPIHTA